MKKLDNKFLVTCGVIIFIPIMILVFLFIIQKCDGTKSKEDYEQLMIKEAESYAKKHKMFPKEGKQVIIKLEDLEKDGLKSAEKVLKDTTCDGSVTIKNNSNELSDEEYYSYIPYLECNDYKTDYLKDHLLEDVVESSSGLYKVGDEYIFKGHKANNYLSFFGDIYRIIKIDKDGYLKLIKQESQNVSNSWDNKYNIEKKGYTGINNYADSNILDRLISDYNEKEYLKEDAKSHIVPRNICVGKRSLNNLNKEITNECDTIVENQVITLPSVTDFTLASYDENCKQIGDMSCTNYNYFAEFINYTWTVDSVIEDSSLVYYITSSSPDTERANKYKKYNWVIYVDSEELYISGDGTKEDPYIIK